MRKIVVIKNCLLKSSYFTAYTLSHKQRILEVKDNYAHPIYDPPNTSKELV